MESPIRPRNGAPAPRAHPTLDMAESARPDIPLPAGPNSRKRPDPQVELGEAVERAQRGDEDAFHVLYRSVQPGLLRYLRGLVGDDAEDVASEAWSQIARDLPSFRGDEQGFRGWTATIARNRAMDHLRYQRRRPVAAGMGTDELIDRASADDTAGRALEIVSTEQAITVIASLPRDQAEAVLLRVVMGLDVATTARVLGKREGAVRTAAHRGLRRLAEKLDDGSR